MKNLEKRAKTLLLLVNSSTSISDPLVKANVADELQECVRITRIDPLRRRRLLYIFHLARGLETALRSVVDQNGIVLANDKKNMGGYLSALSSSNPQIISSSVRSDCYNRLTRLRNKLAHSAGEYPSGDPQGNCSPCRDQRLAA
jgi:hypothetical protein